MSCLFQSIGSLMHRTHQRTRREICDYMNHHLEEEYQGLRLKDWIHWQLHYSDPLKYIQNMRNESEWGGAMELMVATKMYKVDILVVDQKGHTVAEFLWNDQCTARIRLVLQWTGVHYEGLKKIIL